MATGSHGHGTHTHGTHRFHLWPATQLGWWAVGLAIASIMLIPSWRLIGPAGAIPGLSCGLVGGGVALVAMVRQKERAITVAASLVPFISAVIFLLAELAIGHS